MIETIRKEKSAVLLVDCGALFDYHNDTAELHLKAMELMGYDALNLGGPELYFGEEFLARTRSAVSFPYIASNLRYGGSRLASTREYFIKEVAGIKVAILGIVDPADLKELPRRDEGKAFEVLPPQTVLERLLPEVRGKADLVVLLSQLGEDATRALTDAVPGIDVAITTPFMNYESLKPPPPQKTLILTSGFQGMTLGMVTVRLEDKRVPAVTERTIYRLDGSVPDNEKIMKFVETYKKEQALKKEREKRELQEGLQLTPEEFMERYRKKEQSK